MTQIGDQPEPVVDTSIAAAGQRETSEVATVGGRVFSPSPRWLMRLLPWVPVSNGVYHSESSAITLPRAGKVTARINGNQATVDSHGLRVVSFLKQLDDPLLSALAGRFVAEHYKSGDAIVTEGERGDKFFIVASGRAEATKRGPNGENVRLRVITEGDYFGEIALLEAKPRTATVRAMTACTLLSLARPQFETLLQGSPTLLADLRRSATERLETVREAPAPHSRPAANGAIARPPVVLSGLAQSREHRLVTQHLRIRLPSSPKDHSKVASQSSMEQLLDGVREFAEWSLINDVEFGLLAKVADSFRRSTRRGPLTPDDLDELLSLVWQEPAVFLAHPRAISAFAQSCTSRGILPGTTSFNGSSFLTWRGIPLVPTDKVPLEVRDRRVPTTHVLLLRFGEANQGVVGLEPDDPPGEHGPGITMRDREIDTDGRHIQPVDLSLSAAVLRNDALAVLDDVEVDADDRID